MVTGDSQGPSDNGGADPLIGRTLNGRFSILEPIGVGGMGRVYRAQQTPLDRVVALKVLNPNFPTSKDPGFQKRFLREASFTSKLRHPNTVTVIDYGQTDDGIYYIAMEYLEGRTLGQALAESGPLPWARAINIGQQICRSLREAHNQGIVHRDLKPANIMLLNESDQDLVKVLDFGLVKSIAPADDAPNPEITQSGTFLGSPAYMAPEQARNEADVRSDVYSLGVVLYQMLVGRTPFVSKDHIELIFAHHKELPPAFSSVRPELSIPPEIESLVRRCLEKVPAHRPQTMDELLEAMREASMAAGGNSGIFRRPGGQNTTGPHKTPLFAGITGETAENNTLAVDISVVVPPDVQQARRRTLMLGGLVGGGIAVALAGGLLMYSGVFAPKPKAEVAAPAAQVAPAEKPATEQVVRFRLMSQPTGARVVYKGQERGTTPLLLEIPKEKGQDTVTAEFTFVLDGYQMETVITGGSGEVVFAQKMQRARGGGTRNASAASGGRVEHASGTAGDSSTVSAMGSISAPVMMESDTPPAPPSPAPASAPKQVEQNAAPTPAGSLAVPVAALSKSVAPTGDGPVPFQEGMPRPVELSGKDIVYTREALAARIEGTMIVKCVITKKGSVENCRVIKGLPHMNEAVVQSLQSRTYKPITLQGRPVAVDYTFSIRLVAPRARR